MTGFVTQGHIYTVYYNYLPKIACVPSTPENNLHIHIPYTSISPAKQTHDIHF